MDNERKTIYLCLAHMSEEGLEQKYVKEAFDTNWIVPLGPNVNAFEKDLEDFVNRSLPLPLSRRGGNEPQYSYRETADSTMYDLLKTYAEDMRKNPTEAESIAWNLIKNDTTGFKFRRQQIIGDYIVDFVCLEKRLVVEIDGEYHNEWERQTDDAIRTAWLENKGFRVIRFTNAEVIASPDSFITKIKDTLKVLPTGEDLGGALREDSDGASISRKVVCLSAGTAAVHLALIGCGVKAGDEVLVQSFTFCASSHPITYLGAKPVFVGSEKDTWNIDPELLEKAIVDRKEKTGNYPKAIVVVALYGMPYRIDRIMAIADKYGIPVIEDAAEGLGSRYNGQVLGTFGKYGVLSFNGNKMITTSGGGALICEGEEEKNEIMWYATQARDAYPYYQHTAIGYNYRMSNVCAGIGRGQMTVLDAHIDHHKHVQKLYEELLKDVPGIHIHKQPMGASPKSSPEGKDFGVHTADPMLYDSLKKYAEDNRDNPTEAERILWNALKAKGCGFKFRQQHIIEDFIVDFYCNEKKLTIELDGGYHKAPIQMKSDAERSARLNEMGYTEMRFTNDEVMGNLDGVVDTIVEKCKSLPSGEDTEEAPVFDSNFWLCTATIDPEIKVKGQENAYKEVIKTAVGGAAGVIHAVDCATTDCQPNENVEALRVFMLDKKIEARPVWKPMHKQPVYADAPVYTNGVEEEVFKVGFCLPAGPYVTDEDVKYIVDSIKEAIG